MAPITFTGVPPTAVLLTPIKHALLGINILRHLHYQGRLNGDSFDTSLHLPYTLPNSQSHDQP